MATVYFYNAGSADALLAFRSPHTITYNRHDVQEQKKIVINAFEGIGWKVPEMLEELKRSENFYLDQGCQIKMPAWTNGRVALIGDAGYAPAFPTGMGSTLAIQGATALADTMAENEDHNIAFKKYNETFRPVVEQLQATVYDGMSFVLPETVEKINARNRMGRSEGHIS